MEQIEKADEHAQKKIEQKMGKNALIVWTLNDISKRALLSSVRLILFDANYDPKEKKSIPPPIKLEEILEQLIQKRFFDQAWEVSKVFDLKPYLLLKAVTEECIHLDAKPLKGEPRWVAKNRKFLKKIPSSSDAFYIKKTIKQSCLTPTELDRCAAEYAYLLIMFDHLHLAYETLKKKIISEAKKITSRNSQSSIPATEIDWLLWLISKRDDPTLKEDAEQLKDCVERYFERIASFSRQ
ncbi:unnamed protein product [Onchocerca flexuosa]|uniref:HA2 domain-containing protein n=1 Tax=Onchocerca flexuosa TaxID=387005 RepID=A0A183H3A8_9BILA|nr:unnamed protein product [Onchocerca flexuosa]